MTTLIFYFFFVMWLDLATRVEDARNFGCIFSCKGLYLLLDNHPVHRLIPLSTWSLRQFRDPSRGLSVFVDKCLRFENIDALFRQGLVILLNFLFENNYSIPRSDDKKQLICSL